MAKLPSAVAGARIVGERFVRSQRQQNPEGRIPLMDHIRELRNRIVKILLALAAGMIAGFVFFTPVRQAIKHPLCSAVIPRGSWMRHARGQSARPQRSARLMSCRRADADLPAPAPRASQTGWPFAAVIRPSRRRRS